MQKLKGHNENFPTITNNPVAIDSIQFTSINSILQGDDSTDTYRAVVPQRPLSLLLSIFLQLVT